MCSYPSEPELLQVLVLLLGQLLGQLPEQVPELLLEPEPLQAPRRSAESGCTQLLSRVPLHTVFH